MNASRIRRLPLVVVPLALATMTAFAPSGATAQTILKCTGADGTTIFTDKSCEAFGATLEKDFAFEGADNAAPGELREAPATITDQGTRVYRPGSYQLSVGGGQPLAGVAATSDFVVGQVELAGE